MRGGAAGYVLSRQLCKNINENIVETEVIFVHAVTAGSSVNLPRNNAIYNISESIKYFYPDFISKTADRLIISSFITKTRTNY